MQHNIRCGSIHYTFYFKKKGCAKSVIMQAGENRIYRKKDKPHTLKFHRKFDINSRIMFQRRFQGSQKWDLVQENQNASCRVLILPYS